MSSSLRFALALDRMEGVGRVTANRLLSHFATHDELLRYPREQVLTRIKGAPNAQALVTRLFDRDAMRERLGDAQTLVEQLGERHVQVLSPHDEAWPDALDDLPPRHRPFLLYLYGDRDVLARPLVALLAHPPISGPAHEHAQALVRHLVQHEVCPATGTAHGFDIVVHKITSAAGTPSLLVAPCGMAKLPSKMRPTVSAAVRAGGLFLSSFRMQHGPFDHDEKERALVLTALAQAAVFIEPQDDTPEGRALAWAVNTQRPVFGIAAAEHALPDPVHPLHDTTDFDWVAAAVQHTAPDK